MGPLDEEVDRITYLNQLRHRIPLPGYMWPSVLLFLEELTLSVKKVDRKALDAIALPNWFVHKQESADLDKDELTLRAMWQEVLPDTAATGLHIVKDTAVLTSLVALAFSRAGPGSAL